MQFRPERFMGIRDTRMLLKAVEQRWNIPKEYYEVLPKIFMQIALDPSRSPREKTAALKGIIACDRLNLEHEKLLQSEQQHGDRLDMERLYRIAGVAKQLGFDTIAQRAIEAGSGGGAIDANPE